jgi:hypothetical protein
MGTIEICPTASTNFAQKEYEAITKCKTPLPVDANCGHLQEACLTDEMMTPILWADGNNIFSRITIGWLQDLGYTVDYSLASEFAPSRLGPGCNCNRRLGQESTQAATTVLSDETHIRAHTTARQFLENRPSPPSADAKQRERAFAITVLEHGRPYTVVLRD